MGMSSGCNVRGGAQTRRVHIRVHKNNSSERQRRIYITRRWSRHLCPFSSHLISPHSFLVLRSQPGAILRRQLYLFLLVNTRTVTNFARHWAACVCKHCQIRTPSPQRLSMAPRKETVMSMNCERRCWCLRWPISVRGLHTLYHGRWGSAPSLP